MNARIPLVLVLVAGAACSAELGGAGRMREQLDEYTIARPLAQAWPDALRFLNDRGYPPVGADRKLVGLPPISTWSVTAGKGHETQVSGDRWIAETLENSVGKRYRIIGVDLGPDTCRIGFFAVRDESAVAPGERRPDTMYRDTVMEIAFIDRFDPAGAAKMRPKDPGFF